MTDTIRQKLVDAIKARLQTIKTVNGYETNLGNHVFEWRNAPLEEHEMPGLVFRDLDEAIPLTGLVENHELEIEIELYTADGVATPATTRKAIADVSKCIGADATFGGLAQDTVPAKEEAIMFEHKAKVLSGARLKLVVKYLTYRFDSYTTV